jgi:hypothetical protein
VSGVKYLILLIIVALTASLAIAQNSPTLDPLQKAIDEKVKIVNEWQSEARLQIIFAILIIVFGALVGILQGWSSKSWCKAVTVCLGAAITILTGVTNKSFKADYKTLQRAAADGRETIDELRDCLSRLADLEQQRKSNPAEEAKTAQNVTALRTEFRDKLKHVGEIERQMLAVNSGWFAQSNVYAQENAPAWVTKIPQSPQALFFVGTAQAKSLADAKAASLNSAIEQGAKQIASQTKGRDQAALAKFVRESSTVENSGFTYDKQSGQYRYYTLLELDQAFLHAGVLNALAPASAHELQLQAIHVKQDGLHQGATPWSFDCYVNGALVKTLPTRPYDSQKEPLVTPQQAGFQWPPVSLIADKDIDIKIVGHRQGHSDITGSKHISWNDFIQKRQFDVRVMHAIPLKGWFEFTFVV